MRGTPGEERQLGSLGTRRAPKAANVTEGSTVRPTATPARLVDSAGAGQRPTEARDEKALQADIQRHTRVLQRCYELAQRADRSLRGPVTVQLRLGAKQVEQVILEDVNLGKRYLVQCLKRYLGNVPVMKKLPTDPTSRKVVLGARAASAAKPARKR